MNYKIRYVVQPGDFNPDKEKESVEVVPGVRVSNTDVGYADDLVLISIVGDSYLVITTDQNNSEEDLLKSGIVAIQHFLDEHLGGVDL